MPHDSPLIGKTLSKAGLTKKADAQVIDVLRDDFSLRFQLDHLKLEAGDRVVLRTSAGEIIGLHEADQVDVKPEQPSLEPIATRKVVVMEGIVGPHSRLIGHRLTDLNLRQVYGVYILALHRQKDNLRHKFDQVRLAVGDTLLLEGQPERLRRLFDHQELVNLSELHERPFRHDKAPIAVTAIGLVMGLAAFEVMPIAALALIASVTVVALGCLDVDEAYRAIEWRILMLIFGMLALGAAMQKSGAAGLIVQEITSFAVGWGPIAVLSIVYLVTSLLTELVSNNAAAILLTPIAIGLAEQLGIDPRPFVVAVMFAASFSFATPIGYQTNTFVYNAGGYYFTDFLKIGLPLNLFMWIMATAIIPLFWPLQ